MFSLSAIPESIDLNINYKYKIFKDNYLPSDD